MSDHPENKPAVKAGEAPQGQDIRAILAAKANGTPAAKPEPEMDPKPEPEMDPKPEPKPAAPKKAKPAKD